MKQKTYKYLETINGFEMLGFFLLAGGLLAMLNDISNGLIVALLGSNFIWISEINKLRKRLNERSVRRLRRRR